MLWMMLGKTGKSPPEPAGVVVPYPTVLNANTVPDGIPLLRAPLSSTESDTLASPVLRSSSSENNDSGDPLGSGDAM